MEPNIKAPRGAHAFRRRFISPVVASTRECSQTSQRRSIVMVNPGFCRCCGVAVTAPAAHCDCSQHLPREVWDHSRVLATNGEMTSGETLYPRQPPLNPMPSGVNGTGPPLVPGGDRRKLVRHVIPQDRSWQWTGPPLKPLTRLGRPLSRTVIVDDQPAVCWEDRQRAKAPLANVKALQSWLHH